MAPEKFEFSISNNGNFNIAVSTKILKECVIFIGCGE